MQDIFKEHGVGACWSPAVTAWESEVTRFFGMETTWVGCMSQIPCRACRLEGAAPGTSESPDSKKEVEGFT